MINFARFRHCLVSIYFLWIANRSHETGEVGIGNQLVADTLGLQVISHRLRTALRQAQIVGIDAFAAGKAANLDGLLQRVDAEVAGHLVQDGFGWLGQLGGVILEVDAFQFNADGAAIFVNLRAFGGAGAFVVAIVDAVMVAVAGGSIGHGGGHCGLHRLVA